IETHRMELAKVERAVIDGAAEGFAALYTRHGRLVGATYVAVHAGESVPLLTLAVAQKMTPAELAAGIHCYPTQVEAIQRAAEHPARWAGPVPVPARRCQTREHLSRPASRLLGTWSSRVRAGQVSLVVRRRRRTVSAPSAVLLRCEV